MAASIWISDASPLFFYSPSEAYFAGLGLASWIGSASGGGSGSTGTSDTGSTGGIGSSTSSTSHSTTGNAAVILPSIYATAFTPIFSSSASDEYNITLIANTDPGEQWTSGQNWTGTNSSASASSSDGTFTSAQFASQTFQINVSCLQGGCSGSDEFTFDGAWIETELAPLGSTIESVTLDDASPLVQYSGFAPLSSTSTTNTSTEVTISTGDYDSTLSMTSTSGATAQVTFMGASISITGVVCPSCSTYTITLDNDAQSSSTFDSANNVTVHDVLMYFATNLDTTSLHTLVITAQGGGGVVLDSFTVYGPKGAVGFVGSDNRATTTILPSSTAIATDSAGGSTSTISAGTGSTSGQAGGGSLNAGVIVGAILGSLAGLKVAPGLKKPAEKKLNPWDEANLLQNMKNEEVHVTTAANQRYVYPGLIAHSDLKKK